MTTSKGNIFTRDDTFFGICEAIGEDFGFNANWLRVALAGSLYFFPLGVISFYLGLGVLVLASRLIAPDPGPSAVKAAEPAPAAAEPSVAQDCEPLRHAA